MDFIANKNPIVNTTPMGRSMYALFINAANKYITKDTAAMLIA